MTQLTNCGCTACIDGVTHASDCAVHNMPAYPNGACDCGALATRASEAAPNVPEGCTPADATMLRAANHGLADENAALRAALQFYADGSHFVRFNDDAWDTCSGEPTNFLFDEAETAQVEDGSVAKAILAQHSFEPDAGEAAPARPSSLHFHRFVDGKEMAEDILIERARSLPEAIELAVSVAPKRAMTVLVHAPALLGTLSVGNRTECSVAGESCACSFDAWQQNPYTKTLHRSIETDYVPRGEAAPVAVGDAITGPVGEVYILAPFMRYDKHGIGQKAGGVSAVRLFRDLPAGTKLYTAALASQAAPATTVYSPEFVRNKFADYETQILNLREELAVRVSVPDTAGDAKSAHGHRSDYFLLSNARRIVKREYQRSPNWVIAMELFATGSTSAHQICKDAGVDPDGLKIDVAQGQQS